MQFIHTVGLHLSLNITTTAQNVFFYPRMPEEVSYAINSTVLMLCNERQSSAASGQPCLDCRTDTLDPASSRHSTVNSVQMTATRSDEHQS